MDIISTDTLGDTAAAMAKIADDVDEWIALGHRPQLPDKLVSAAGRITAAMQLLTPPAALRNLSIGQLVVQLLRPDELVTAKAISPRVHLVQPEVTNHAVSVAMHRSARRGLLRRPHRGVYQLAADRRPEQQGSPEPAPPEGGGRDPAPL